MAVAADTSPSLELEAVMDEPSPTTTPSELVAPGTGTDDPASSITVNTKAPPAAAANFPPPKTDKPRPHVCTTCQRSFARLEHLKRHERSHTKEKPFECPECTRCFARRDLLLRHQQKLHQTTTPSSRPRNRRESASGAVPAGSRARKNSVASTVSGMVGGPSSMRPRANTISHVDGAAMSMIAAANANVARGMPAALHGRHPSLAGLPLHQLEHHPYAGMASAMGHRGVAHGLPKLETHGIPSFDPYGNGLRTAPPMGPFHNGDLDFEGLLFGPGSTINPSALHYSDSPSSMAVDPMSPFAHGMHDMTPATHGMEEVDWLVGFEQQMSFHNNIPENAVDGSSPSAISSTSQSGVSDVMLDGSNHHPVVTSATSSSFYQPAMMGPPQMTNPYGMDLSNSVFPDMLHGSPLSPQIPPHQQQQKGGLADAFFSGPPASLNSISPAMLSGLNNHPNMNHALNYAGTGPETPSSINGSSPHGTSPVSTITDSTRSAILGALSFAAQQYPLGGRRYSFGAPNISSMGKTSMTGTGPEPSLPSTKDLQRYVQAYISNFHKHMPFLHLPTLSFEMPDNSASGMGGSASVTAGRGCLILSLAAIGALYEQEREQSQHLFEMAKKMIHLYLEERRKANVRRADFRRLPVADHGGQSGDSALETPLWLVQSMLLNVIYGHNCGEKRAGEIAAVHAASLVSLARGADLLKPARLEPSLAKMDGIEGGMFGNSGRETPVEAEDHMEWLNWKTMEERKRTLYAIFHLSSMLVTAYNQNPTLTNSEIRLDLPCDEEFFAAESAAAFQAKGGIGAANHNRIIFHDALGKLLFAHEKPQFRSTVNTPHQSFAAVVASGSIPETDFETSTFGLLVLINALHNYIWETRQQHHNRVWTNEETEKLHRHLEPALKAWQAAWASDPRHSLERPNPFGAGPLSADSVPLMDLAYVRLFVNMSRTKEKFWQRDWDGLADELARGPEIIQHAEHSPDSNDESVTTDPSVASASSSVFIDSPATQSSSPEFSTAKFPPTLTGASTTIDPALFQSQQLGSGTAQQRSTSRREKHLRKAAFYAADSLTMSDRLGITFADFTSRELPMQAAMCAFDCSQVLAEWVATLQDRVGRYLGILGQDDVDLGQVPAIMLLEEEDVKLLGKIQDLLTTAEMKMNINGSGGGAGGSFLRSSGGQDQTAGFATKILRVTAFMLRKAAVWPITHLTATCLEHHAETMRARAEKSVIATGH